MMILCREPVSSEVVKKAINAFSHSFEEQLTEKVRMSEYLSIQKRLCVSEIQSLALS